MAERIRAKRQIRKPRLTHQRLLQVLSYHEDTGRFTWNAATNPRAVIGEEAGCVDAQGYIRIMIDNELFTGHRLAWFYKHAEWPTEGIMHLNNNGADNSWANLKARTKIAESDDQVDVDRVRHLFDYDADAGKLIWKNPIGHRVTVGSEAGFITTNGYRYVRINGRLHLAHRLIWAHVHGVWPEQMIDHINGQRADNRLVNLRSATPAQNVHNAGLRSTNTSGYKGVSFAKSKNMWTARIYADYRLYVLGYFRTREKAAEAYNEAAKRLHGEFANFTEVVKAVEIIEMAEDSANSLK